MRTLLAVAAAMMLAASVSAISRPSGLVAQPWSSSYYNRWYTLETGVSDLMIEGTSSTVVARQMTTGTTRATWTNMDGDDWRMVDGTGTSASNRLKIYSYDTTASRTVLTVKTLGTSMTSPTFTNANYTLPTWRSAWYGMASVDGVIYMYSNKYLIGLSASTGALVTNMTVGTYTNDYISSNAVAVGYAYADGAKFLTFKLYNNGYRQITVDLRRNSITMDCATSSIYSSSNSYADAYPAFAPAYSNGSSTIYPMIFAWGSLPGSFSSYSYGAMVNATPASCSYIWRRSTSSNNIPSIRLEGRRTSTIRPGMPFTFQDTTNAIYASFDSISNDGNLVWLNYRTGVVTRNLTVDTSINVFTDDQCSSSLMAGPSIVGTDLILSFDLYLYQYTSTGTQSWSFNYGSVFSSSANIDDAGCAAWSYKGVGSKTLFVSNGGGREIAAMAIGSPSTPAPPAPTTSAPLPPAPTGTSSFYSPYYRVTMTNGQTGSSARTTIQSTLFAKYGITSSSLSSWSYSGSQIDFRIYYGSIKSASETNAAIGLSDARTNSTLRSELGFSALSQSTNAFPSSSTPTPFSSEPGTYTFSPGSSSTSSYSPYYQVTMTNGQTGSTAKATIQFTLFAKYGITSSSLSSWSYSGNYITFRVWYGSTKSTAEINTASGLLAATTNSTLRSELGFASCTQTIDPNFGAAVAAAFGTLFIVLILIGVAILICVIAIIVCCCCCTAKAVADASAPPQQVVMANQAAYVPMQPVHAQPGQIQGAGML